jgi:hypothetical protein
MGSSWAWMLPETVLLIRRIAGAKRGLTAAWTGRRIPEAYQPITGTLRERLRIAVRDPGTLSAGGTRHSPPILTDRGLVGAVRALAAGWGSHHSSEAECGGGLEPR